MDRYDEQAKDIIRAWSYSDGNLELTAEHDCETLPAIQMQDRVAAALRAAATVPDGFVRVGSVDHKLSGSLLFTADGVVIGNGASVWPRADLYVFRDDGRPADVDPWTPDEEAATACFMLKDNSTGDTIAPEEWHADKVYSSPEAAQAAANALGKE